MICLYILFIASVFTPLAQAKELKMLIWSEELAPIVQWDSQSRTYAGILIDIFNGLPKEHQITLDFVLNNRSRGEFALYDGEADVSIFSREWMQFPDKLLYSEPIYVQQEYLYSISPVKPSSLEEMVNRKIICTRRGYIYPALEPFFNQAKSSRMDSRFEITQFKMLRKKRCDLVIADELVGEWVIEKNNWQDSIYRSEQIVDMVNFTIAFHPSKHEVVNIVNKHIKRLRETGNLDKIIYRQRSSFKKGVMRFNASPLTPPNIPSP